MRQNKSLRVVAWLGAVVAPVVFAQATTTITMLGDPQGVQGPIMGDVYTSPYYANVGSNTGVPIICDDFFDDTYFNESWTAYVTPLSSIPGPGPQFSTGTIVGGTTLTQEQAYTVGAYLATEIMETNQGTTAGQMQAGELSYALWALFSPTVFTANGPGCTLPDGCLTPTELSAAENYETAAWSEVQTLGLNTSNFDSVMGVSGVTIYTYDSAAGAPTCLNEGCPPPPQEFISVTMPEPSLSSLLAIDLLGLAGLVAVLVKRRSRRA